MNTIKGTYCSRDLPIGDALRGWITCIDRLTKSWQTRKDLPWWYNERADLSTLSAAIWLSGGTSIEEFQSDKRKISKTTGNLAGRYLGRIDFLFTLNGQHYVAEAKESWSSAVSRNPTHRIRKRLADAQSDIRKVRSYRDRKIAIVFVKPTIPTSNRRQARQLIDRWMDTVQAVEVDAKAWYFPDSALTLRWGKLLCPGVLMLIKER